MAEKAEKKSDAAAAPAAQAGASGGDAHGKGDKKKVGGLLTKTPVLLGGVMLIEAAVLFAGFKMLGGSSPKPAPGAELAEGKGEEGAEEGGGHDDGHGGGDKPKKSDKRKTIEIQVVDFKAPNKVSGRTFLFEVSIFATAKGVNEEQVKAAIKDREALIKDRIRTIIAQADPEKLVGASEPGLETLRRQVKYQLDCEPQLVVVARRRRAAA
jgi:flagellar basal body-associated protein FliL